NESKSVFPTLNGTLSCQSAPDCLKRPIPLIPFSHFQLLLPSLIYCQPKKREGKKAKKPMKNTKIQTPVLVAMLTSNRSLCRKSCACFRPRRRAREQCRTMLVVV